MKSVGRALMKPIDYLTTKVGVIDRYAKNHLVDLIGLFGLFAWLFIARTLLRSDGVFEVSSSYPLRLVNEFFLAFSFALLMPFGRKLRSMPLWAIWAVGVAAMASTVLLCLLLSLSVSNALVVAVLAINALCQAAIVTVWAPRFISQSPSVLTAGILASVAVAHAFAAVCSIVPLELRVVMVGVLPLLSVAFVTRFGAYHEVVSEVNPGLSSGRMASVVVSLALLGFSFGMLKGGLYYLPVDLSLMDALASFFVLLFAIVLFTVGRRKLFCNFYNMAMFALIASSGLLSVVGVPRSELLLSVLLPMQQIFLGIVWIISPTLKIGFGDKQKTVRLVGWPFALLLLSTSAGSAVWLGLFRDMPVEDYFLGAAMLVAGVALVVHFFLFRTEDVSAVVRDHKIEVASLQRHLEDCYGRLADHYGLTEREKDLLLLWVQGYSAKGIADKLSISQNTVRSHIRHIYSKTKVDSRDALIELGQGF